MAIKLVVFDIAGTTVKDQNFVGQAFSQAMEKNGYPVPEHLINPIMGYKKPVAIRMLLADLEPDESRITDQLIDRIHTDFVNNMIAFYLSYEELAPLPGVEGVFEALRTAGVKIGLDTGFSKDITDIIIKRLSWEDKVDAIVASDEVPEGRPAPYMIQRIMNGLGISSPEEVAKVGDTEVDINEGLNAGCRYIIGVTTGSFTRGELEPYHPTHIVDHISEVLDIVLDTSLN